MSNLDHALAADILALLDGFRDRDADAIAKRLAALRAPLDAPDDARGALILAGASAQCADLARALAMCAAKRAALAERGAAYDRDLAATLDDLKSAALASADASAAAVAEIRDLVSD